MQANLEKIKADLKDFVKKNQIRDCLETIEAYLVPSAKNQRNEVIQHIRTIEQLNKEWRLGTLAKEAHQNQLSRTAIAVLELIDDLDIEVLSEANIIQHQVNENILVICFDEEGQNEMQRFFSKHYFINVDYNSTHQLLKLEGLEHYDIILFDDYFVPKARSEAYIQLIKDYLNEKSIPTPLLYFSKFHQDFLRNRAYEYKVYFSNSIFSLHARIQEMIQFKKYYA